MGRTSANHRPLLSGIRIESATGTSSISDGKTAHYAKLFRAGRLFGHFEDVELASGP